jgi:hypothetical protein
MNVPESTDKEQAIGRLPMLTTRTTAAHAASLCFGPSRLIARDHVVRAGNCPHRSGSGCFRCSRSSAGRRFVGRSRCVGGALEVCCRRGGGALCDRAGRGHCQRRECKENPSRLFGHRPSPLVDLQPTDISRLSCQGLWGTGRANTNPFGEIGADLPLAGSPQGTEWKG